MTTVLHNPREFLFVEKYRPQTLDDCILPERILKPFREMVKKGEIINTLLVGTGGVGKTTVAKSLCKELGCDYIVINCSENGNIDTLRTTIREFASTVSLDGGIKVVIMDESDGLTTTCFAGQQEVTIVQDGQEVNVPIETLVDMGECSFVTYDLATGKEKETRGYAYISGEKEVYKYTFDDGSVVYSTDDHKFFDEQGNEVTLDIGAEVISR